MLRDKNLVPLSHQHQHALALCVRIERASPIPDSDLAAWQAEIDQLVRNEIAIHFAAEEQVLFPAAKRSPELIPLVEELIADHASLRLSFSRAGEQNLSAEQLSNLAGRLSTHIRKEERQLFERLQQLTGTEELAALGQKLEEALRDATQACSLPTDATRLRAKKGSG
jgi:iron-sulfur cluster repair protein YtfE (RIC family)